MVFQGLKSGGRRAVTEKGPLWGTVFRMVSRRSMLYIFLRKGLLEHFCQYRQAQWRQLIAAERCYQSFEYLAWNILEEYIRSQLSSRVADMRQAARQWDSSVRKTQGSQQEESRLGDEEDEERSRRGMLAEPSGQFQKWEARCMYAAEQEGPGKDLKLLLC